MPKQYAKRNEWPRQPNITPNSLPRCDAKCRSRRVPPFAYTFACCIPLSCYLVAIASCSVPSKVRFAVILVASSESSVSCRARPAPPSKTQGPTSFLGVIGPSALPLTGGDGVACCLAELLLIGKGSEMAWGRLPGCCSGLSLPRCGAIVSSIGSLSLCGGGVVGGVALVAWLVEGASASPCASSF